MITRARTLGDGDTRLLNSWRPTSAFRCQRAAFSGAESRSRPDARPDLHKTARSHRASSVMLWPVYAGCDLLLRNRLAKCI